MKRAIGRAAGWAWLMVALVVAAHAGTLTAVKLSDVNGKIHTPLALKGSKAAVFIFITDYCPEANAYGPEINRICEQYASKGVKFYLVECDPSTRPAEARKHAVEYSYRCPVLLDRGHQLVKLCGATTTTEVAVFTPDGKMQYRGRIDDRYYAQARAREGATTHELRDVLEAIVKGQKVAVRSFPPYGCVIPTL